MCKKATKKHQNRSVYESYTTKKRVLLDLK